MINPQGGPEVRGREVYRNRATFDLRFGAGVLDGAVVLTLFFLLHRALRLSPVPEAWWLAALILLGAGLWAGQRIGMRRTLGGWVWKLRADHAGLRAPLLRQSTLAGSEILSGAFLTFVAVMVSAWSIDEAIFRQPIWARAETLTLEAYLPDMSTGQWEVLPFFYSLGAWPRLYHEKPVFYSLPYEKGPPLRFVGHVTARWEDPGTRVTFEGPKTPDAPAASPARAGEHTPRELIRLCLLGETHSWGCLKIREATLQRHLTDMQQRLAGRSGGNTALKMKWELRWFSVKNAALSQAEQAQGIYLSAEDEGRGEERYILITENGTHQAIWLDYPRPGSQDATLAQQTFAQAVRSLRASDELGPGRAWIDRSLENVKLDALVTGGVAKPAADTSTAEHLADVQSMLLAKITVQPSIYESYFHLGGTALLLNRMARSGSKAGHLEGLELAAIAKPLIQSAYKFAQDLDPGDPRTTQLQGYWLEAQKR